MSCYSIVGKDVAVAYDEVKLVQLGQLSRGSKIVIGILIGFGAFIAIFAGVCGSSACSG